MSQRCSESTNFDGIEWIIVSLGSQGAFAKHRNKYYKANIPHIEVVNPVGSVIQLLQALLRLIHHDEDESLLKS